MRHQSGGRWPARRPGLLWRRFGRRSALAARTVPRVETDHWLDLDPAVAQHCMVVSQFIGKAQQAAFNPTRIALLILGMEVPHVHVHVQRATSTRLHVVSVAAAR